MGSPYLNSGEAIILTTNRVSADAVPYDVMLTSERIFLIDNRNARFEPRIIPLSAILSVQGGKTPAHDPVITLLFRSKEAGDERQPLNLVFSQNPAENRKPERDDWMRSLIQLSINQHEKEGVTETPLPLEATEKTELRPSVRHGVAPEMVRPLSNVVDPRTTAAPVTVIPDETEGGGEIPARALGVPPVREASHTPQQLPEESATNITPVRGSPLRRADFSVRVVIPQIIEEALPAPSDDTGVRDDSPRNAVPYLTVTEKPALEPLQDEEPAMVPTIPVIETGQEQVAVVTPPAAAEQREVAEIIEELLPVPEPLQDEEPAMVPTVPVIETGQEQVAVVTPPAAAEQREVAEIIEELLPAPEPLQDEEPAMVPTAPVIETREEQAAAVTPPAAAELREVAEIVEELLPAPEPLQDEEPALVPTVPVIETGQEQAAAVTEPEPVHANPDADIQVSPESHVMLAAPDNTAQESVGHPAPEAVFPQEPAVQDASPVRQPAPPARESRPYRTTLVYTVVLLLIVALVAAGAVLLLSQGSGQTDTPVTPTMVQVTTVPPETVLPTIVPPATVTPATTRIATPIPSLPVSPVPQVGVWVRVNSTAYYMGNFGNPGQMQQISGTGDYFYKVLRSDQPVQVSIQKQDNSGALLAVAIYRDGTLVGTRSVTSPLGTVYLLIDPLTGRVPGLTENDTLPEHAGTPTGLENY